MKKIVLLLCLFSNNIFSQIRTLGNDLWDNDSITTDGFGDRFNNKGVYVLKSFQGQLYAGTGDFLSAGTGGKIFKSSTGDLNDWVPAFNVASIILPRITVMCNYKDSTLFVGGTSTMGNHKIYRTEDGIVFKSIANLLPGDVSNILTYKGVSGSADSIYIIKSPMSFDGDEIWVASPQHTDSTNLSSWRKALDFGDTAAASSNSQAKIKTATVLNDTLYIGIVRTNGDPVIYKTGNGINFIHVANANTVFGSVGDNIILSNDGTNLFAGTKLPATLWQSSNGGTSWTNNPIPTGFYEVTSINYLYNELWVTASSNGAGGGLLIMRDQGSGIDTSYSGILNANADNLGVWGNTEKFKNNVYYGFENNNSSTGGGQLFRLGVCNLSVNSFTANPTTFCLSSGTAFNVQLNGTTPPYKYEWTFTGPINNAYTAPNVNTPTFTQPYVPPALGSYAVSLTVTDFAGCTATDAGFNITAFYRDIKGNIKYNGGANSVGSGIVIAYDSISRDSVGYDMIGMAGDYTIPNIPPGKYFLLCYADTSVANYKNLIPTYYGDDFLWDTATVLNHSCDSNSTARDIHMQALVPNGTGQKTSISGRLSQKAGYRIPGDPIPGRDVKIGRVPPNGIIATDTTFTDGTFKFSNIDVDPSYTYTLYIDMPAYTKDASYSFVLTPGNMNHPRFDSLNYIVDSNTIWIDSTSWLVGINDLTFNKTNTISINPNPSISNTSINYSITNNSKISLGLYNTMGIKMEEFFNKEMNEGKYTYQFNHFNKYPAGVYYIVLMADGKKSISKLIITK